MKTTKAFDKIVSKGEIPMTEAKAEDRLDRLEKLAEEMFAGLPS
ncbi:MAG: hypothetical protein U5R49_07625 [Deltaproteobacteria bacterium]|nr:hypothetical protein [Deltaproteobacteria bacterium]